MKKNIILLFFIFVICNPIYADKGSITFEAGVKIFEPTQRALIAWNKKEEILLLSTDLRASKPTKVLEVIPLPSEPVVKKGDIEVFKKAVELINEKLGYGGIYHSGWQRFVGSEGDKAEFKPAGKVTFHEKIGVHDVLVTNVLDINGFIDWVEKYLKSSGVDNPVIPETMKEVINEYLDDGFSWFVFDVVSLEEELKTNEAIQYRFATDSLFYPLKISRTEEGDTSIGILVLTSELLTEFSGISNHAIMLPHDPVIVTSREVRSINEEMDDLFGHKDDMELRIWEIKGDFSSFDKDLIVR